MLLKLSFMLPQYEFLSPDMTVRVFVIWAMVLAPIFSLRVEMVERYRVLMGELTISPVGKAGDKRG